MGKPNTLDRLAGRIGDRHWEVYLTWRRYIVAVIREKVRRMCGRDADDQAVEDAAMNVALGAAEAWRGDLAPAANFIKPFLAKRARGYAAHMATVIRRQRRRSQGQSEFAAVDRRDPLSWATTTERDRLLRELVSRLPEPQRVIVSLTFFAGQTHTEIAKAMKCTPWNVGIHQRRAMHRLRRMISGRRLELCLPVGRKELT